jgi:methyltransferase (TIGR00027 family)
MRGSLPSSSAQTVAMCRAVLHRMGIVDDPLAEVMLRPGPRVLTGASDVWPLTRLARSPTLSFLAARTKFFDDAVTAALDDGIEQVAIIGAGYDSRAWRLCRPGVRFFEVDRPATQADKRTRAPSGGPSYVAADVAVDDLTMLLSDAGLDATRRSVLIVEGLTMYLSEPVVRATFEQLAALAPPGSRLAANFTVRGGGSVSPISRAVARIVRATWRARGEPIHDWARHSEITALVTETGWFPDDVVPGPALASRYLSDSALPTDGLNPGAICLAATRR